MRNVFLSVLAAVGLLFSVDAASAQAFSDGCGVDPNDGVFKCLPGARPGVPYRPQRGGNFREERYREERNYRDDRGYREERGYRGERYGQGRQRGGPVSDGCAVNRFGRMECMPGARPGVPYYGPQRPGPDGCGRNAYGEYACLPGARPRQRY